MNAHQAGRVLDFVEQGRGGTEVLAAAEATLGTHPKAVEGIADLRRVFDLLDASGVDLDRLHIDLGLARGLDYYTGVVFETTVNGWEKFGSISSGGRYDNLAGLFSDRKLPGVGASIGVDRLLALLEEAGELKAKASAAPILIADFPGGSETTAVRLASILRAAGIGAEVYPDPIQIGKQMGYGTARGHRFAVIVGPDEETSQVFNLRNLTTREERKAIPWSDLVAAVRASLEGAGA